MTRQERWLYRDMLDVYYDKERPLPADIQAVCDCIGATNDEQPAVAKILRLKFNPTETGWVHERCEIELSAYRASAETARSNGKKGGRPPKITQPVSIGLHHGSRSDAAGGPEKSGSQANHKPLTINHTEPKPSSSSDDDGDAAEVKPFDQFWAAYPRRVAKAEAQKAWTKLKPDAVLLALILTAIERQKDGDDWRRDDGQFIPHPATWLRAGRWLDEVRAYVEPAAKLPPGWWTSHEGMKAAGAMLNPPLSPNMGELPSAFKLRIEQAIGRADPTPNTAQSAPPAVPYTPPSVPAGIQLTDEQRQARRDELKDAMRAMTEKASNARAGVPQAAQEA